MMYILFITYIYKFNIYLMSISVVCQGLSDQEQFMSSRDLSSEIKVHK